MKKLKNKWFYLNSFLMYVALIFVFFILTLMFIEQHANSFLVSNFVANKWGSNDIIEVVVDDVSIQEHKWPWSKDMFAEILDYFHTYSTPKVIGLDMNITSFDDNNPNDVIFAKQVSKMPNLVLGFVPQQVNSNKDIDSKFMETFAKKYSLNLENKTSNNQTIYNSVLKSPDSLINSVNNYGSVKIETAEDTGYVFSTINLININNSYYPSLPLKMYLLEHGTNDVVVDLNTITVPKTGLKIPYMYRTDGISKTFIKYYKNIVFNNITTDYSHLSIPASMILDTYRALKSGITPENSPELYKMNGGKYVNPDLFNNKVIFIGANISGPSADVLKTPMVMRHPGVDIQATVYDNLKNNEFLTFAGFGVGFISFVLLSLFAFILIMRLKFLKGLISIILIDLVYLLIVFVSAYNSHIISFTVPLVLQFVTAVFAYSFKFISENRNKEKIKQAMGKYLSQDIMKNVVRNIDDLKLGGKRAIVTVLFSDIRGFTSLSEKMSAEEVSMILNEYFAEMEPIITKYNGVINKFIGDAVMAIFGEPIQDINHPQNAVKCAYEMLKKVEYLREKWLFEGKPRIEIGVGINTGEVFIGNIGTETRMEYTVIGDTVNLASRIESYNKVYKTNLLVSSSTYASIAEIADVIKISEVQIRGKAKKMNIYEVLRIDRDK